jgi:hypothetical protein
MGQPAISAADLSALRGGSRCHSACCEQIATPHDFPARVRVVVRSCATTTWIDPSMRTIHTTLTNDDALQSASVSTLFPWLLSQCATVSLRTALLPLERQCQRTDTPPRERTLAVDDRHVRTVPLGKVLRESAFDSGSDEGDAFELDNDRNLRQHDQVRASS